MILEATSCYFSPVKIPLHCLHCQRVVHIPGTELKLALLTPGNNGMAKNVVMWACGTVTICGTAILLFLDTCGTAILFFLHVWYRHPVFYKL